MRSIHGFLNMGGGGLGFRGLGSRRPHSEDYHILGSILGASTIHGNLHKAFKLS